MWQIARATMIRNQLSDRRAYPWAFTFGHIINGAYIVLVSFFAYHYLIHGQLNRHFAQYTGTKDYLTYAIIGGLLNNLAVAMMMNVSRPLVTEWREGTLEALLLAPAGRSGYILGTTIQQMTRVSLEFLPVCVLGIVLGLRLPHAAWASSALALFLYLLACFAMAMVLGSIMLSTRDTYIVQNTLFATTTLLCGFQFPTQYLPHVFIWLGQVFPLTDSLKLLRGSLLTGQAIWGHGGQLITVIGLSCFYIVVGSVAMTRVERRIFERDGA